jgi:uncharacterized protein
MTVVQIIGFSVALLVMFLGVLGSVIPGVPGTPLVLLAAVGHRLCFGAAGASNWVLLVLGLLTLLSLLIEWLAGVVGTRKFGGTWRGIIGALVGGVAGMFFGLPGIILGPIIGAVVFELAGGSGMDQAARAGVGTLVGWLVGSAAKVGIGVVMIGLFALNVLGR